MGRATCCLCVSKCLTFQFCSSLHPKTHVFCLPLVTASDEEEGAGLFDSAGKAPADPFDTSSGSVQLIAIKASALPVVQSSDRGQESSAALNGEVSTRDLRGESSWSTGISVAPQHVACSLCPASGCRGRLYPCVHQASMICNTNRPE